MFTILFPAPFANRLADVWALGTRGTIATAFEAAVALQEEAQAADDCGAQACGALQAAWFAFQMGSIEQGLEHATAAKRMFQELGSKAGEGAAVAMGAWLMLEAGLAEEAALDAERALTLVGPDADPGLLGFVTAVLGVVMWYSGQAEMAIPFCAEAVALAERAQDPVAVAWWRINLAGSHAASKTHAASCGQTDAGREPIEEAICLNATALLLATEAGDLWCQALALCNAAEYFCAAGRIDDALAHLASCDALPWVPTDRSRSHYTTTRAEALLLQGRPKDTLALCEAALRDTAVSSNLETKLLLFKHVSTAHEQLGAFEAALGAFKRFHSAQQHLMVEKAQRHARIAGIRYETHRLRRQAEVAQAQVASLVLTAQSDPLTGLPNRRAFDQALADLARTPRAYALALVDLDHFKQINDRFSHLVGDAVLRQVGTILAAACPVGDLVARVGGEEFVVLVRGSDSDDALPLCETLRQAIAAFPWSQHHPQLTVTTSIGVARFDEAATPMDVLALADQRLYGAKGLGRNCVVDASDPAGFAGRPTARLRTDPASRRGARRSAPVH